MKQSPLSRVEGLIRKVVETPFTWLAGDALDPFRLASYLVHNYGATLGEVGTPTRLAVNISAQDYEELGADVDAMERQVADYVTLLAERQGLRLETPHVTIAPDTAESPRRAHVIVELALEQPSHETEVFAGDSGDTVMEAIRAVDAFLIVQGRQHVALDRPVTRIGRRMDNDIVLDASSISRHHAQIRWRQRYFVLYDVSSHGRTAVNGAPTREHILRPGDVIALSDSMLVYGEGREAIQDALPTSVDEELGTTQLKPEA